MRCHGAVEDVLEITASLMPRIGFSDRLNASWRMILVIAACSIFLFLDAAPAPIVLWDESRLAVNALEMHLRGVSLVTTYGFVPDLWNTKPPLMIWAMDLSLWLFGPSEWSLRLPSALAAIGTLLIVFDFTRRISRSFGTAALATVLLTASAGFFGEHGARTADYDALLCFFVMAYLHQLFFALHRRAPGRGPWVASAALAAALMTKGIAAPVAAVGLLPYLALVRRLRRPFADWRYYVAAVAALVPLAIFLLARERAAPGYLSASLFNDVAGRVALSLGRENRDLLFYPLGLIELFSAGSMVFLIPFALPLLRGRARLGFLYMLCAAAAVLLVSSAAATKYPQYIAAALPPLAVAGAVAASRAYHALRGKLASPGGRIALSIAAVLLGLGMGARAADLRWHFFPSRQIYPRAMYGHMIEAVANRGYRRIAVIDTGIAVPALSHHYVPQLRSYALIWRERGIDVRALVPPANVGTAEVVASCDATLVGGIAKAAGAFKPIDGCAARPVTSGSSWVTGSRAGFKRGEGVCRIR
jgi:4-amino-4-deoxy-L-arabinose transferase-like glycosyltransferase